MWVVRVGDEIFVRSAGGSMETLILNGGIEMPALGFGVFQTPPDETMRAPFRNDRL